MKEWFLPAFVVAIEFAARAQTPDQIARAVKAYPELANAGSPLNRRFLEMLKKTKREARDYAKDPDWVLHVAGIAADTLANEQAAELKKRRVFDTILFGDSPAAVEQKLTDCKTLAITKNPTVTPTDGGFIWSIGAEEFPLYFEFVRKRSELAGMYVFSSEGQNIDKCHKIFAGVAQERYGPPTLTVDDTLMWKLADRQVVVKKSSRMATLHIYDFARIKAADEAEKAVDLEAIKKAAKGL